jgi:hypothetical protein
MLGAPRSSIDILQLGPDDWMLWRTLRLQALGEAPDAFSSKQANWQGEVTRNHNGVRAFLPFPSTS